MYRSVTTLIRNAYGGISRAVWLLSLAQFINRSGTMVIFFLAVYLKDELHFGLAQVGVIMGCFGAGSLLGVILGGRLADKLGYKAVMLGSLLAGGIMFLVMSAVYSYALLCVGMFLLSAFGDAFRPASMVAIAHYSTRENYTRSISLYRFSINLGFSVGPAMGGLLATYSYQLIFWADGVSGIGAAILIFWLMRNSTPEPEPEEDNEKAKSLGAVSPFKDKAFLFFLPLVTLYAIAFFQFFTTMSIYYKNAEMLSEGEIGLLLAFNGVLVSIIEMIMIYKIEKKGTVFNWIILGAALLVISYVMLLFVHGLMWMLLIMILVSFSEMLAMPFMNTYVNERSVRSNKGQYASLFGMSWSVAQIATPIIATQVMFHLGYNALWITLSMVALSVIVGIVLLKRWSAGRAK